MQILLIDEKEVYTGETDIHDVELSHTKLAGRPLTVDRVILRIGDLFKILADRQVAEFKNLILNEEEVKAYI